VGDSSFRASTATAPHNYSAWQREAEDAVVGALRAQLQPLFVSSLKLVAPTYLLLVLMGVVDISSSRPQHLIATCLLLTLVWTLLRVQVLKGEARRKAGIGE
jgi:hypothetical protein